MRERVGVLARSPDGTVVLVGSLVGRRLEKKSRVRVEIEKAGGVQDLN